MVKLRFDWTLHSGRMCLCTIVDMRASLLAVDCEEGFVGYEMDKCHFMTMAWDGMDPVADVKGRDGSSGGREREEGIPYIDVNPYICICIHSQNSNVVPWMIVRVESQQTTVVLAGGYRTSWILRTWNDRVHPSYRTNSTSTPLRYR